MSSISQSNWVRVLRQKRAIEQMMEAHTLADVMAREQSPYLPTNPSGSGNRAERRRQSAQLRKAR